MKTWTFPERRPEPGGPWDDEPDKAQWIDETTGYDCLIVRQRSGALCGYVGLPPGHPLHGADYDAAHDRVNIEVHGGLTFAAPCQEGAEDGPGVCHVPEPGRPADVWWLGFDCAHAWDVCPGRLEVVSMDDAVYRTFDYVRVEVTSLARQLAMT